MKRLTLLLALVLVLAFVVSAQDKPAALDTHAVAKPSGPVVTTIGAAATPTELRAAIDQRDAKIGWLEQRIQAVEQKMTMLSGFYQIQDRLTQLDAAKPPDPTPMSKPDQTNASTPAVAAKK